MWVITRACRLGLDDYGFRVVVAPSFADIFANNSLKNGLLTVVVSESDAAELMKRAQQAGYELAVDLKTCASKTGRDFRPNSLSMIFPDTACSMGSTTSV